MQVYYLRNNEAFIHCNKKSRFEYKHSESSNNKNTIVFPLPKRSSSSLKMDFDFTEKKQFLMLVQVICGFKHPLNAHDKGHRISLVHITYEMPSLA